MPGGLGHFRSFLKCFQSRLGLLFPPNFSLLALSSLPFSAISFPLVTRLCASIFPTECLVPLFKPPNITLVLLFSLPTTWSFLTNLLRLFSILWFLVNQRRLFVQPFASSRF